MDQKHWITIFCMILVPLMLFYFSFAQTEKITNANFTSNADGWTYGETDSSNVAYGQWNNTGGNYDSGVYLMVHNDTDSNSNPTSEQWINYSFSVDSLPRQSLLVAWYKLTGDNDTDYHFETRFIHNNGTEFTLYTSSTYSSGGFNSGWTQVNENITVLVDETGTYTVKLYVQTNSAPLDSDTPTNLAYLDDIQVNLYYPPNYYDISKNDTNINSNDFVEHRTRWTDDSPLSYATLEVNGTGGSCDTWDNVSSTTLSGTEDWSNLTWTIPTQCEGETVGWRIYANDSNNYWNVTTIQRYSVNSAPDNTKPYYTSNQTNNTSPSPNEYVKFSALWYDNIALDSHVLSWNASGNCDTWANTTTLFSETNQSWSNTTKQIPDSCNGQAIGWRIYANDTSGNYNSTDLAVLDIQNEYITITVYNEPICFGSVNPGSEYPASDGTISECGSGEKGFPLKVEVDSNVNTDIWLNASSDLSDGENIIDISNLRYNESSNPSIKTGLSLDYQLFKENIGSGKSNQTIYWWMNIPSDQIAGDPYQTTVNILVNKTS